tara:strand:+ start:1018 stop:1371 length:354 start_codon:yes stop_codon:yes gene_type:complete
MIIELNNNIQNTSLQVGDFAYFSSGYTTVTGSPVTHANSPELIGKITAIGHNFIEVSNPTVNLDTPTNAGHFLMFSKDTRVNKNSLIGYYAEVELENDSTDKIELFSLSSEVTQSSK